MINIIFPFNYMNKVIFKDKIEFRIAMKMILEDYNNLLIYSYDFEGIEWFKKSCCKQKKDDIEKYNFLIVNNRRNAIKSLIKNNPFVKHDKYLQKYKKFIYAIEIILNENGYKISPEICNTLCVNCINKTINNLFDYMNID